MKRMKRSHIFTQVLCLLYLILPITVSAQVPQELGIHILCNQQGILLEGVQFDLYQVATYDAKGELVLQEAIQSYPVEFTDCEESVWSKRAATLESYLIRDQVEPYDSGVTDEKGEVHFPAQKEAMEKGLYLILGHSFEEEGQIYTFTPFWITLPNVNPRTKSSDGQVYVDAKYGIAPASYETEFLKREVVKIWKDEGYEDRRPYEIKIQLLRDGELYETVTLNAQNKWKYVWDELDANRTWKVTEEELSGYSVEILQDNERYIVTNTYKGKGSIITAGGKLPQTGQLWWPVLVLIIAGLFFIVMGLAFNLWDDRKE